jgi:hypothetical protein
MAGRGMIKKTYIALIFRNPVRLSPCATGRIKDDSTEVLSDALKFIFSWVVLLSISVIVSGKLLALIPGFKLAGQEEQKFQVKLPGVLNLWAKDQEVTLGFALFLVQFFLIGIFAHHMVYRIIQADFGINLGQFNAICAFSAFSSVFLSSMVLLMLAAAGWIRGRTDPVLREHASEIDRISRDGSAQVAPSDIGISAKERAK